MSEEKALLAAIDAHPLDDAPRLVYADWLDEHGGKPQTARAEFIRVQCELDLLPLADSRYAALEKRAQQLLKGRKKEWLKPVPKKYTYDVEFWRGFPLPNISHLEVTELLDLTEDDLKGAPLWYFDNYYNDDELDLVLRWPALHRLTTFGVSLNLPQKRGWAKKVAACAGLRNVTDLSFSDGRLSTADLKTVLDAWTDRRLRVLLVNECPIGDAGIKLIAKHPATANLRKLYAHTTKCTGRAMKAVADGPNLDRLAMATFGHNQLGEVGAQHLLRWKALDGIHELFLMNTKIPKRFADQLRKRLGDRVDLTK